MKKFRELIAGSSAEDAMNEAKKDNNAFNYSYTNKKIDQLQIQLNKLHRDATKLVGDLLDADREDAAKHWDEVADMLLKANQRAKKSKMGRQRT